MNPIILKENNSVNHNLTKKLHICGFCVAIIQFAPASLTHNRFIFQVHLVLLCISKQTRAHRKVCFKNKPI